jgi:hypothetical protein
MARSLALGGRSRDEVRTILQTLGFPADVRAERLSPKDFRAVYEALS